MKKILVTDSLFIFDKHVQQLKDAGYEVVRLDKPDASEKELITAIKGVNGYILGGVEYVTDAVIEAADSLEVIVFTGSDYKNFIPGWELATEKGIKIANFPDGVTYATAEYTFSQILNMTRHNYEVTNVGDVKFKTAKSLNELNIGIVGMGRIAKQLVKLLQPFEPKSISYHNRTRNKEVEAEHGITYKEIDDLFKESDVLTIHIPSIGEQIATKERLAMMKDGSVLINTCPLDLVDMDALYSELESSRLRTFYDWSSPDSKFNSLPISVHSHSNDHAAFNTTHTTSISSDAAVESIVNLLDGKEDKYWVNK